jgi:cell wall-associated NlpC family hydrolase
MRFMRILGAWLAGMAWLGLAACSIEPRSAPASPLPARGASAREPLGDSRAVAVVGFAVAQLGKRYCWGGTGPECFDCSGLVKEAWASVGVHLPRTTGAIASDLPEVPMDDVRVGDILWWPGHVGLYAGNGWLVDALDKRHGVVRRRVTDPVRAFRPM